MTSILERAIEHVKSRNVMTPEEFNDIVVRDVGQPITGDEFARILACGSFRSAASASIKRETKGDAGPRVHNVVLQESYATEDSF